MSNDTRVCAGCDTEIAPGQRERNVRKWCSDACRRRAYYLANPDKHEEQKQRNRERTARKRAAGKGPLPNCEHCGQQKPTRRGKFCNAPQCQAVGRRRPESFVRCSKAGCVKRAQARSLCITHYQRAYRKANPEACSLIAVRANRKRRAMQAAAFVEHVELPVLLERAGWVCGICSEDIPKSATFPDVLSPSLDHVIPLSRGGKHEYANAQAAHYGCNAAKQDKVDFVMS